MLYKTKFGFNVSVKIVRDSEKDSAKVHVFAPMYIKKHWVMGLSYKSSEFSDSEILRDSNFVSLMEQLYR